MTHHPGTTGISGAQVELGPSRVGARQGLWAGIGTYRLGVEGTVEKIRAARAMGANGVLVFSHESLTSADWKRLRQEAFASPARTAGLAAAGASISTR